MQKLMAFVAGALMTALLGWGAHAGLGLGPAFVDHLESRATVALGNAGGAAMDVVMERDPVLTRIARLSGNADAATRARLIAAVRAVPGVAGADWASDSEAPNASAGQDR